MTTIRLRVYGEPAPQGSKKLVRGRLIETSKKLPAWRKAVTDAAAYDRSMRKDQAPLEGPLETTIAFFIKRPRKHYRTGRYADQLREDAPLFCAETPDKDKLERAINDALTIAGIWHDDAQVVRSHTTKLYAGTNRFTGAVITIRTIEENQENTLI